MTIRLSASTKFMAAGILLSLGWFVLESCDCDTTGFYYDDFWVACVAGKPTLMASSGSSVSTVSTGPLADFSPANYDCKKDSNSPPRPRASAPADLPPGTSSGPSPVAGRPHATPAAAAYLPQQLRLLPFLPYVPPSATPTCDSSFPDVLQTDQLEGLLTRITTCPFAIKITIPMVPLPLQVAVTPDGSTALVTSFNSALNFVNLATNTVSFTLMTDPSINPDGIAISPDGTRAYITSFNTNGGVSVIELASRAIIATIPTNAFPQGVEITPDGSQLWVTYPLGASVDIFDTLTNTRVTGLNIGQSVDVAFNSTGTHAYITSSGTGSGLVTEMDTSTYKTLNTYAVGSQPVDISISYADQFLVVNNYGEGSVSVIDLGKNAVVTTQLGGNSTPTGISWVH
jgi:DNA-binding beta-propeller fold protein YncE